MTKVFVDAIDILDSIVIHLTESLQQISRERFKSIDRSSNPHENDLHVRQKFEHWVAYTGSNYDDATQGYDEFGDPILVQSRELEFASYVRVESLQNDHRPALVLHQQIMALLNGFNPTTALEGIRSPLTIKSDTLLSPRGSESTFRYQALYKLETIALSVSDLRDPIYVQSAIVDVYRSDINYVKDPERSILDDQLIVKVNSPLPD
jgi:hypothetical protein